MARPRVRAVDIALALYLMVLAIATLYPFQFQVPRRVVDATRAAPHWDPSDGMVFDGAGMFSFQTPRPDIADAIEAADAFYLYLEARPDIRVQEGPARIVTYSRDVSYQAFMVGQQHQLLSARLRKARHRADEWGQRSYRFEHGLVQGEWAALLLTCDQNELRLYRDGELVGRYRDPILAPATWDRKSHLVVGNEADGERAWFGRVRRLELGAGQPPQRILEEAGLPPTTVARLEAQEEVGDGTRVLCDISAHDGRIPEGWVPHKTDVHGQLATAPWSLVPFSEPSNRWWARADWVRNAVLLIPLGLLLALRGVPLLGCLILGALVSLSIEVTQVFLPDRHPQMTDLVLNSAGALVGALLVWLPRRTARGRPRST